MTKAVPSFVIGRRRRIVLYALSGMALLVLCIAGIGRVYQLLGERRDRREFPPPGKLVDVGGYRLHTSVIGEGTPVVVFESGLDRASYDWALVAPEVARFTTAVAYDRAGLGWSDRPSVRRGGLRVTEDLHRLLTALALDPPYILVGHSCGGLFVRLYRAQYPDEVCGLVLVDSAHENDWDDEDLAREYSFWHEGKWLRLDQMKAFFGYYRWRSSRGELLKPQEDNALLPIWAQEQYQISYRRPDFYGAYLDELLGLPKVVSALKTQSHNLGSLPLATLSGVNDPERQAELVKLSTNSRQLTHTDKRSFEHSHFLQWSIPQRVVDEIEVQVDEARSAEAPTP